MLLRFRRRPWPIAGRSQAESPHPMAARRQPPRALAPSVARSIAAAVLPPYAECLSFGSTRHSLQRLPQKPARFVPFDGGHLFGRAAGNKIAAASAAVRAEI